MYNPILYRAIKILGNGTKGITSVLMQMFPRARHVLPHHLPAKRTGLAGKRIPRIIWQTNHSDRVTLPLYANFMFNRFMTPEFEYRYHSDEECEAFIREHFPGAFHAAYRRLQIGAAKADFWRILVLLKEGGIYLDIDSNFSAKPERVVSADEEAVFIEMDNGEVTNYCIAAAPGHPALRAIAERIAANIEAGTINNVYQMTGPTVVDAVVKEFGLPVRNFRTLCTQGQFTNKRAQYHGASQRPWTEEQRKQPILKG